MKTQPILYESIPIDPVPTYAPWLADNVFMETFNKCRNSTLVDICRNFELWNLVEQLKNLQGSIMEVGLWKGGTASVICKAENLYNNNTKIYLCDTFKGVVKATQDDNCYVGGEHAFDDEQHILNLVQSVGVGTDNIKILRGIFPDETQQHIPSNELFKFCHIDVDVYQGTKDIIEWIWPKMVVGGIVVSDDYGIEPIQGVTKAINHFMGDNDKRIMYNLNGHAVIVKVK